MEFLEKIRSSLDALDRKTLYNYLIGFCLAATMLVGIAIWFYYRQVGYIKRQISAINAKRREASVLLERHALVKKQQAEVDAILAKNKNFKISETFEQLLQSTGIAANKAQEPETTSEQVLDGYTEWTLHATLNNLSMKKLSELLYAIEQEERIYIKEVDIERNSSGRFVNVKITIATLEPKTEVTELTEQ